MRYISCDVSWHDPKWFSIKETLEIMKRYTAILVALALGGCASTYSLTPVASGSQDLTYDQGIAVIVSKKENWVVGVAPTSTAFEGRVVLRVVAFNDSEANGNFGIENVRVFTSSGKIVRVFTYDQLVKEAKNKAAWQAFAVAMAASANAYAASQPATINSYGTAYGANGTLNYSSTSTIYNPANTALTNSINQSQTRSNINQITESLDATLSGLGSSILRTTTIEPGNSFGGNVVMDRPVFAADEDRTLRVIVSFDGEEHEFKFSIGAN